MSTDPQIRALVSGAVRARRLPAGAACATCGTSEQLVRVGDAVRCYAHRRSSVGAAELHHLAGRENVPDLVVPLTANAHRRFHDDELATKLDELPPAGDEPLLLLAHVLKGIGLLLLQLARWLVAYVAGRGKDEPPEFPVVR